MWEVAQPMAPMDPMSITESCRLALAPYSARDVTGTVESNPVEAAQASKGMWRYCCTSLARACKPFAFNGCALSWGVAITTARVTRMPQLQVQGFYFFQIVGRGRERADAGGNVRMREGTRTSQYIGTYTRKRPVYSTHTIAKAPKNRNHGRITNSPNSVFRYGIWGLSACTVCTVVT